MNLKLCFVSFLLPVVTGTIRDSHGHLRGLTDGETLSEAPVSNRVIGGSAVDVAADRYPYYGLMYGTSMCGSALITPSIAIGAAHCQNASDTLYVGKQSLGVEYSNFEAKAIARKVVHPSFVGNGNYNYDLMIMQLDTPSEKQYVPLNADNSAPHGSETLWTMGFGDTTTAATLALSNVLNEVDVTYVPNTICGIRHGIGMVTDGMMCAAAPNKDACLGDSGGPLVSKGTDATSDVLMGLVSWGRGCADPSYPGVYVRIGAFYDWIVEQVCSLSPEDAPAYMNCGALAAGNTGDQTVVKKAHTWLGFTPLKTQLDECEGDCDTDADCAGNLICLQRSNNEEIPGCSLENAGILEAKLGDFCIQP